MLNYELKISPNEWNIIEEVGYPEDDTICIVLYQLKNGDFDWIVAMYSKENHNFYVDYGYGGLVLEQEVAYAWCESKQEILRKI